MRPLLTLAGLCLALGGCTKTASSPLPIQAPPNRNVPGELGEWVLVQGFEEREPRPQTLKLNTGAGIYGLCWNSKGRIGGGVRLESGESVAQFGGRQGAVALPANAAVTIAVDPDAHWTMGVYRYKGEPARDAPRVPPDLPVIRG